MSSTYFARVLVILLTALALSACGKPDKPKELLEIEALWQDPATRQVKDIPGARSFYEESRKFRYDAQDAYNDGEVELSREYAIYSKLRYRTAIAIAKQFKAKEQLDAADARVATLNPELTAINAERNKLTGEVADLERQLNVAKRQRADEDRRRAGMATSKIDAGQDNSAKMRLVDDKLRQLDTARNAARSVNAQENAAALYNRAENQFKSLQVMRSSSPVPYDAILSSAEGAIRDFDAATQQAQPGYKVEVQKQDPVARRAALANVARTVFGGENVITEGSGVRIVAPASFDRGASSLNSSGHRYMNELTTLAKDYDEFSIRIEGFTSKGDPTENLGLSQLRARAAEDAFIAGGIKSSRVDSSGQGQERIRFPDDRMRNERVEIVFSR